MDAPIGVFDSGVGGLTVAKEIMNLLPNENIIYFGDTARVPYGSKSKSTIVRYSKQIIRFLLTKNVKAIVIACNTVDAYAWSEVVNEFNIPIMGVAKQGAEMAITASLTGNIGVIGTEGTISSGIYTQLISHNKPEASVLGKACPLFVPLVEEGLIDDPVTDEIARRYLSYFEGKDVDTLVLGCTHYPLIKETIQKIVGDNVNLINPALETAKKLKLLLQEKGIANNSSNASYEFYVSDKAKKFEQLAELILNFPMNPVQQVDIENY